MQNYLDGLILDISPENITYQMESSISMLEDIKSPSMEVKGRIIKKLKQIAYNLRELLDKRVKVGLIEALGDSDDEIKIDIMISLSFTRDPMALPFFRKILTESSNYELKRAAAFSLGEMKFVGSSSVLIESLACDDIELQLEIIEALSKLNDRGTAPAIVEACKTVPTKVKFSACGLLCKFEFNEGYEFIKKTLGHESPMVKKEALLIAREYPGERFLEPLHKILNEAENPEILALAIETISKIDHPEVIGDILKHLHNEQYPEVRATAVKALGSLNDPAQIRTIADCLRDESEEVKINAALALGEMKSPEVISDLLNIIDNPSEKVRVAVITAVRSLVFWLSDITEKNKLTYALMSLQKDPCEVVRAIAVEALGYLENPDCIEALVEALNDEAKQVRENATAALGSFNDPRVVATLVDLLANEDVVIRWNAVTALTKIGDTSVLSSITRLTSDPDESVRMAAKTFIDAFMPPPQMPDTPPAQQPPAV